uniref:B3 domain-containing protein n=1 Tax=Musa acuminata subsp. malaccensis TaxID=214687 RepID=A0A804K2J1_MUSAM|nr:PREDICTED: B3 domain-containing protein Os07g0563300-like isoform X2 [Musa acuminata subsp. malaccensis]
MSSPTSVSLSGGKICFNSHCKEVILDHTPPRKKGGWRLRSGEIAELCDRCSCAFEQGSFCETFHSDVAGWRNCEACGKRVHCGCVASAPTYVFLDVGGVECIACARKSLAMAPNQMLSSPMLMHQHVSERRDLPVKSGRPITSPFSGQWRQAPHMWNMTSLQSDLQQRLSYEFDRPSNIEKLAPGGRHSISAHEKKFEELPERIMSGSHNNIARDRYAHGNTGLESFPSYNKYKEEVRNTDVLLKSFLLVGENDPDSTRKSVIPDPCSTSSGVKIEAKANSSIKLQPLPISKEDSSPLIGLAAPFSSTNGSREPMKFLSNQPPQLTTSPLPKQFYPEGIADTELQIQMRNGRARVDARSRTQLLPRYWPRITDQELQQISGDTNSVITPLFEKMLSASDAGRIGRLVLPKKCAEAYFPTISQPEGLPLKVQDASGKDWVFQFRFWPNNNSRMYVLEGVTPCIQAMQLQAGDTVTFSRIDPEGKLVMGFRKASSGSTEQDTQTHISGSDFSTPPEGNDKIAVTDLIGNVPFRASKASIEPSNPINAADKSSWPKFTKAGFIQQDGPAARSLQVPSKRKASTLGSKSKRLRIENEESMELKLTWEEAQELLRPPPNSSPGIVVIEGHEFEEYEEAPVLGKRTYFTTNPAGENYQWAQCEDCLKWRKLPIDALLPFKWTCTENVSDPQRSSCSSAQELNLEQIAAMISCKTDASKRAKVKVESNNIEVSDGLDTLANLAILGEGKNLPTSQPTTRHPRHRPGCTCIVCIQPPSGKGPKHKQTCTCNVCLTVKRRFRTLMLRREKRQSEKESETARKQQQKPMLPSSEVLPQVKSDPSSTGPGDDNASQKEIASNDTIVNAAPDHRRTSPTAVKAPQIDLNIQPEREEDPSPKSDTGSMMRLIRDSTTRTAR